MAADDELKGYAEAAKTLGDRLKLSREEQKKMIDEGKRLDDSRRSMRGLTEDTDKASESFKRLSGNTSILANMFGGVVNAAINATNTSMSYANQFSVGLGKIIPGLDSVVSGFDGATKMAREFSGSAIQIGSMFGENFGEAKQGIQGYEGAVLLAQHSTYDNIRSIELQTKALAQSGISLSELSKTFGVAGSQQNMLSVGFRLAQDSGLESSVVFDKMAAASRKMGLSIEDSNKPILALESLARSTGLPITDMANKIFELAEGYARFGMSVDSISPILRRFTGILGEGFKGLAIDETRKLVEGLAGQVNKSESAFMAMQSGMARPGSGVAGAMIDYEDAMAKPEEAMKMLSASLSNIGGGKIMTFQDAHASEANATQFKIQRDMLGQLTGINDPQQTRTLLSLLAEQQSGKQLSAQENKTLADAMKSGADKQEESRGLAERIGQAQVGLLSSIALSVSTAAQRAISPQAQAGLINTGTNYLAGKSKEAQEFVQGAIESGKSLLESTYKNVMPQGAQNAISRAGNAIGSAAELGRQNVLQAPESVIPASAPGQQSLTVGGPSFRMNGVEVQQASPSPQFGPASQSNSATGSTKSQTSQTTAPNTGAPLAIELTIRGNDELTRSIANAMSGKVGKTNKGHS
jgi:hypothetical protein